METALKIENLNKHLGKRLVIKDLSLETYIGEVFGFLGPNGAGKTTTIKLIVGLLNIEEGSISVCGKNISKDFEGAMSNIGGIVENPELYKYMTGLQNLRLYANMRKNISNERINEVVELVGLSNRINEKVGKYSLGMRQRLGLAQSLLHRPKVLILDEPTNGLDPNGIKQLRDILKNLAHKEQVCVFISSHLMSEMELMCDRVGIIVQGSLKSINTIDEMLHMANGRNIIYQYNVNNAMDAAELISKHYPEYIVNTLDENQFTVSIEYTKESSISDLDINKLFSDINKLIIQNDYMLYSCFPKVANSLEDAFIQMTDEGGTQIA